MNSEIFNQNAIRYDHWYIKNKILFKCEIKAINALDLKGYGCSIGVGTGILDSEAPIDIGIEPALNMLKIAITRKIKSIQAVGEYLPFRDGIFDFTLMSLTICFLINPEHVIQEIYRVLRSGGEFAICIVPKDSLWGKEYMRKAEKGHIFYSQAHFYSFPEIKDLLNKFSFQLKAVNTTLSFPPTTGPTIEEPSEMVEGRGFICLKAVKTE